MVKQFVLLIVILVLLLLAVEKGQTIQVFIVLPHELVPYYEWLFSFPGLQQPEEPSQKHDPSGLQVRN